MKATEQYFSVLLFIILCKVGQTFETVGQKLKCNIQMKATEPYFPMVLFIMLYKVVLTFSGFVTIQIQAIEQYFPVLLFITLYIVLPKVIWNTLLGVFKKVNSVTGVEKGFG